MFDGANYNRKHRVLFWILSAVFTLLVGGGSVLNGVWQNWIQQESATGEALRHDNFMLNIHDRIDGFSAKVDPLLRNLNERSKPLQARLRDRFQGFRERNK